MQDPIDICMNIVQLATTYLDFKKWGFQEIARLTDQADVGIPSVIYGSDSCKIRISFSEWHPPHQTEKYTIDIYYGRLSAPNDKRTILSNNEECYCWHELVKALHFLDGSTPELTARNLFTHERIKKFRDHTPSKSLNGGLPEWEIRKHSYIWKQYAPRLFELFDLRRPELWEQYRQFLKEVYDIKGRSSLINPAMDKVC